MEKHRIMFDKIQPHHMDAGMKGSRSLELIGIEISANPTFHTVTIDAIGVSGRVVHQYIRLPISSLDEIIAALQTAKSTVVQ